MPHRSVLLFAGLLLSACAAPRVSSKDAAAADDASATTVEAAAPPAQKADDGQVSSGGDAEDPMAPADLDAAAAAFEEAERELASTLGATSPIAEGDEAGPTRPPPTTPPPPAQQPKASEMGTGGRCQRSCRALASMARSADRLCSLTGRDDPRCDDVETRLRRARARVESRCESCG